MKEIWDKEIILTAKDSDEIGRAFWIFNQHAADTYSCPNCKPGIMALVHGGHDMVNIHLGKELKTPEEFENLYDMVTSAYSKYSVGMRRNCSLGQRCPKIE